MPYLGNPPAERFTSLSKQTITGNGGTAYTLDFPVGSDQDVEVFVNNVRQEPSVAYTVSGTSLTMTGAVQSSDDFYVVFQGKAVGTISHPAANALQATSGTFSGDVNVNGDLAVDTNTLFVDASTNKVGIKTSSPARSLSVIDDTAPHIQMALSSDQAASNGFELAFDGTANYIVGRENVPTRIYTNGTERMRIDASGNLLVGTTSSLSMGGSTTAGFQVGGDFRGVRTDGNPIMYLKQQGNDGQFISFYKDTSLVGSIGTASGNPFFATASGTVKTGLLMVGGSVPRVLPCNNTGSALDNSVDLGQSSSRYDDIFATNGTIQTSDRNEKQDIEALTDAEQRVAVAAKGLMRKFRWKDAYALKGDDARIHFGIIAQDLQAAFEAEGLDAGRYAMFIHSEWWETTETYTDDDGVEQTRTNTYDSEDEAPDGAVKKSRMGVRYSELLAFIIAAI
jgi:hypothetical protein